MIARWGELLQENYTSSGELTDHKKGPNLPAISKENPAVGAD
jgi:hypothetical protein